MGQIVLLNGAQCLGRSCVTTQDNEMAAHLEQTDYCLTSKLIDHIERTASIGGTGIIAQVEIIVLGQQLADAV
jgi:hypothetical protein